MLEHSGLITHSGLQFGGLPMKLGKQEQDGEPLISLHSLFDPQGEGTHGFLYGSGNGCCCGRAVINMVQSKNPSYIKIFLRGTGKHLVNGSPVYPDLQLHIGL